MNGLTRGMGRAILFARDMGKMTAFYRDVIGLTPLPDEHPAEEWQLFDAGPCELALHAVPAEYADGSEISDPPAVRHASPLKLVFAVDDVDVAREALVAKGVRMLGAGPARADGVDPEGNVFQISSEIRPRREA